MSTATFDENHSSPTITTIGSELDDDESQILLPNNNPTLNSNQDFFHQLEARFRAGWERITQIKGGGPSLYSKKRTEKQRLLEIAKFIDDSPFSISTYHSLPEQTKALASLWQIPFTSCQSHHRERSTIPFVFSLLRLRIPESEDTGRQIASNATFTFSLEYGSEETRLVSWSIKRSLIDIIKLHSILTYRHVIGEAPEIPKFPSQLTYIIDFTVMLGLSTKKKREDRRLRQAENRKKMLERYFIHLLTKMGSINCKELCEFLEVSLHDCIAPHSIGYPTGWRGKEGFLLNKSPPDRRSNFFYRLFWLVFYCTKNTYYQKWFVVREGYIAIFDDLDEREPIEVILCDRFFDVFYSNVASINPLKPMNVKVVNGNKKCEFLVDNNFHASEWAKDLDWLVQSCVWGKESRFDSYAPIRSGVWVDFFVDAEEFYLSLCSALEEAKYEVFIHGFWVSPELSLRRPASLWPQFRLDRLLERKASQGVKIYIIVYKEVSVAMSINSLHTKTSLERLHPNITVVRHPDHFSGSLYWSHHEKLVCIDQSVAFTGGLDLSFGRFDTCSHQIKDPEGIWNGIDYSNPIVRDFRNIHNHECPLIDRSLIPRLPWHDIHCCVRGPLASDISRHFVERWNFIKSSKKSEKMKFLMPSPANQQQQQRKNGNFTAQSLRSVSEWSSGVLPERSIYNAYLECIRKAQNFIYIENQFFLSRTSPDQQGSMKNCIAQEILAKIIEAHKEQRKFKVIVLIPLMPGFETLSYTVSVIVQTTLSTISKGKDSLIELLKAEGINPDDYIAFLSLRTFVLEGERATTEQIYVHSKVMIVDDRWAIIGSANINDRSLLGVRDSEHGLYLEETALTYERIEDSSPSNKNRVLAYGKSLRSLRLKLFEEHFACSSPLFVHPWRDEFFELLLGTSRNNSKIYHQVFECLPNNQILTWDHYKNSKAGFANTPPYTFGVATEERGEEERGEAGSHKKASHREAMNHSHGEAIHHSNSNASHHGNANATSHSNINAPNHSNSLAHQLAKIKGKLVEYPLHFLEGENLLVSMLSPEYFLPVDLYI